MLYGVVDVGSNSVRLNVYLCEKNDISILFSNKENLGLIFYIKDDKLTYEGVGKLISVLKKMRNYLDLLKIDEFSFIATASLRNIKNRAEVIQLIEDELEIEINLLSGKEEGELSFYGSISTIKNDDGILIDVGGGSVEIVLFRNRLIVEKHSIPVGSLKLYNQYVSLLLPNKAEGKLIKERVCSELEKTSIRNEGEIPLMCVVGGAARAIGKLLADLNLIEDKADLVDFNVLKPLEKELKHNDKETYNKILHVKPSRIHTLVPALLIVKSIAYYFGCKELQISKFSIREGYLFKRMLNGE
jgi:exopolyphosphatase/guanosine-5'-triphosphate,3'-diphosphate pyrophosphatase